MKRTLPLLCLFTACLLVSPTLLVSQGYDTATGNPSFAVNFPIENGSINITNGNLHMEFPLATHQQRGALQLNERLVYDSKIWMIGHYSNYYWWPNNIPNTPNTQGGWRFVSGAESSSMLYQLAGPSASSSCPQPLGGAQTTTTYYLSWSDPSGAVHKFDAAQTINQDDCNGTYTQYVSNGYATDASGYQVKDDGAGNPIVLDSNGTQVYPGIVDRYGNYWSKDANGNLVDDLGRVPVVVSTNGNITYYDVLAANGTIDNGNGKRVRYTVTTAPVGVKTNFHQPLSPGSSAFVGEETNFTLYPIQSIQLPDGTAYTFDYDKTIPGFNAASHYGEVTSVTLPTGAVIHYDYEVFTDSFGNKNRWVSERKIGSDPATTFTHDVVSFCAPGGTGCREKTTVHRPSGDETVYEQTLNSGAWNSNVTAYTGSVASGQQLFNTVNTFDFSHPCSISGCTGAQYITKSYATTTLSNGLQSQVQYVYNNPQSSKVDAVKEWDYYSGSASATPTRETDYTYTGFDIQQTSILDETGSQVGKTTYGYTTSATATSGVAQHGSANSGGPYLQTVSHWKDAGSSLTTTYAMEDTGMVRSVSDPKLNSSTYTYQCQHALPNQVTDALGHMTTYGYDCNSGALTSVQDPNDLAANRAGTTYSYEAVAGRPYTVNSPDGGHTTYTYPSSTEVDTSVTATPNPSLSSKDILDSLGRTYQHTQAGNSTETTYDSSGRVNCVTNPHATASPASASTCITLYDGLGRPKTQTQPDGSTLTSSYDGNVTTTSDEVGNSWQRTSNVFGKLVSVTEPGSLVTSYSYDPLGNLSAVTQAGASGESPRNRSFTYDSLSRLISATSPETGNVSYGYLSSGALCSGDISQPCSKTDARGVTTNYTYDALNRLTFKRYSDGTPTASFAYDGHAEDGTPLSQFGIQSNNAIGRLSIESNQVSAAQAYSYDAMGRIVLQNQFLPSINNWGTVFSSSYDLSGNMKSFTYPDGRKISQGFDDAGRMSSVNYSSWNGVGKSASYLTVNSPNGYDPTGSLINATMGNGVAIALGYDSRERINSLSYGPSDSPYWSKQYAWYPNSNLQSQTDRITGVQRQFGYDNLSRLKVAQDIFSSLAVPSGSNGNTGSTSSSGSAVTPGATGAIPWWTNPDDSNLLTDIGSPNSDWHTTDAVVTPNYALAPDGTMTATKVAASGLNPDPFVAGPVQTPSAYSMESMRGSVWLRSTSGTQTVKLFVAENYPGGFAFPGSRQVQVTEAWQQFQVTGIIANNVTSVSLQIGGGHSISANQEFLMWNPMLEDEGTAGTSVTNFAPFSQRFTASNWTGDKKAVVDNAATAPDGTQTAAILTALGDGYLVDNIPNPAPYSGVSVTGSLWLRAASTISNVLVCLIESGQAGFNIVGGQRVTLTPDWQRFQVTATTDSALSQLQLQIGGGESFSTGQQIQMWGAQMELASTAGPYVATGSAPVTAGTTMTNLLPNSQPPAGFNAVAAPDGATTAAHVVAGSSDVTIGYPVQNVALYNSATITGSVYLKSSGGAQTIKLYVYATNASGTQLLSPVTASLSAIWQRFSISGTLPNGLTALGLQIGGDHSFTTGQSVDLWGPQLEIALHPGPYIATHGLPVVAGSQPTNILPNSQTLNGPSWGVNGSTLSTTALAPDNSPTATAFQAPSLAADSFIDGFVPNPSLYDSQTVTGSVFLRTLPGVSSQTVKLFLINIGEQGWGIANDSAITLTPNWQRYALTATLQNGLSQLCLQVGGGNSLQDGQGFEIWGPQFAIGSNPAPYMPTTSTTTVLATGTPGTLVTNGLNQTYSYDSFGNLQQNGSFNSSYTAKNQMFGYAYDASGNLLSNGLTTMTWDAESRLKSAGGATYIYDAAGNRVETQGVGVTDTVYFGGRPIARLSAGTWTDLIYGPTGLLAEVPGYENAEPVYRLTDHLGSAVGSMTGTGVLTNPVDFTPFGQVFSGNTNDPFLFTGLERDGETGLDHTQYRQYSSNTGRWNSPDPYSGSMDLSNPQSLNRYSYVGNMPLGFTDPSGLESRGGEGPEGPSLGGIGAGDPDKFFEDLFNKIAGLFSHPTCNSCNNPRPNGHIWDEHGSYKPKPYTSAADILGLGQAGCEFGSCGGGFFAGPGMEDHHIFPQAFQEWFEQHGIDIESYTIALTKAAHRLKPGGLHTKSGGNWNARWKQWIEEHPNASPQEILNQGKKFLIEFGVGAGDVFSDFFIIVNPCVTNPNMPQCQIGYNLTVPIDLVTPQPATAEGM